MKAHTRPVNARPVIVTFNTGSSREFGSISAAAKSISGNGTERFRTAIYRALKNGGGHLSNGLHVKAG